jgi:hypothetical protein
MYIANVGSSSVSILGAVAGYPVRFEETGLAPETSWSVTGQGVTRSSTSSTVTFYEPNGSYVYTLDSVTGYTLETNATGISDVTEAGGVVPVDYLARQPPPPPPAPFPWTPVLLGLGVVGLAALLA